MKGATRMTAPKSDQDGARITAEKSLPSGAPHRTIRSCQTPRLTAEIALPIANPPASPPTYRNDINTKPAD